MSKHGAEISGLHGSFTAAATALGCPEVGSFAVPGKLTVSLIKVSSKQKVWAVGKKFARGAVVPVNIPIDFKDTSVKGKLWVTFSTHQKPPTGGYKFKDSGYLFEASNDSCGSAFQLKHP